jgi:peptidyl-tRNA hydrolase, PTH1 family
MALFQRKPQASSSAPLYTLGLQKTTLIVGLGNAGKEYDLTRHNVGFLCVDKLRIALDGPDWTQKKDLKCQLTSVQAGDKRIVIIKPTTFMNLSGEAVQAVMHFYKIPLEKIVVVHDELDIPFGQIRTRVGGSSAGHNGIKSVSQHIGEEYGRIRVGIGAETNMNSADFVLAKFSSNEQDKIDYLTKEVTAILTEYIYGTELNHETRSFIN